jgi:hypothetical protein
MLKRNCENVRTGPKDFVTMPCVIELRFAIFTSEVTPSNADKKRQSVNASPSLYDIFRFTSEFIDTYS